VADRTTDTQLFDHTTCLFGHNFDSFPIWDTDFADHLVHILMLLACMYIAHLTGLHGYASLLAAGVTAKIEVPQKRAVLVVKWVVMAWEHQLNCL